MIAATEYPLTIERGSTFQKQFRWKVDGQLVDLTGRTAKMQLRKNYSAPVTFELNTSNSRLSLGGVSGLVSLDLSPEETSSIPQGNYVYDLEIYNSGETRKLIRGTTVVQPEVTV
jgi:hypothetical protein